MVALFNHRDRLPMQTIHKTQYHCAELRRSVAVIQRIEQASGIDQDDTRITASVLRWVGRAHAPRRPTRESSRSGLS